MRSAAGVFALVLGFLAVEVASVQVASTVQLDNGGDIAIGIIVAVPLLVGGAVSALFLVLHPRPSETSVDLVTPARARSSARSDLQQLLRLTLVGSVLAVGVNTSPWITVIGALTGAGVALSWLAAYRSPLQTGPPPG